MNQRLGAVALLCLVTSLASTAHAQSSDIASSLFQQARTKMEAGDFKAACPLLDESYRQDPKPGTLFTLANCRDREGKLAGASGRYGEYVRAVDGMKQGAEKKRHAERREIAEKRLQELEHEVPTLKLVWPGGFPADLKVRVDDVELSTSTLTVPLPFDPGEHTILLQRAGRSDISRRMPLEKGRNEVLDLSNWDNTSPAEPAVPAASADATPAPSGSGRRKAGFALLGVGGAALAFGGVMGTLAILQKQTVDEHCKGDGGYACDATGFAAVEKMRTYVDPSTIGFIAGGIFAATGLILVIASPAKSTESNAAMQIRVRGAPGQAFVGLEGRF